MFYKVGKKTTKMEKEKFLAYVKKEKLHPDYITSGLVYYRNNDGDIKAKISVKEE